MTATIETGKLTPWEQGWADAMVDIRAGHGFGVGMSYPDPDDQEEYDSGVTTAFATKAPHLDAAGQRLADELALIRLGSDAG